MPGQYPKFTHNAPSYAVTGTVTAGQLVMCDTTVTGAAMSVKTATAASTLVIGCALTNAAAAGTDATSTVFQRPTVTTVQKGAVCTVTYAASATGGQKLKAAASGAVTPWVDGTDTDAGTIVGICVQGSVSSSATGLAYIY